jgi:hypothetical protein
MSIVGFAANPGTDVLPTCSTVKATSLTAAQTLERKRSKASGQPGLYSTPAMLRISVRRSFLS